jgi:hypothetical protein
MGHRDDIMRRQDHPVPVAEQHNRVPVRADMLR